MSKSKFSTYIAAIRITFVRIKAEWGFYAGVATPIAIVALSVMVQNGSRYPEQDKSHVIYSQQAPKLAGSENQKLGIKADEEFLRIGTEGWIAIFTGVLTLATIGLWTETKALAKGAEAQGQDFRKSLDLAERHAEAAIESNKITLSMSKIQNRAYLEMDIGAVSLGFQYRRSNGLLIRLPFHNYGLTPAKNLEVGINFIVSYGGKTSKSEVWSTPLDRTGQDLMTSVGAGSKYNGAWKIWIPNIEADEFSRLHPFEITAATLPILIKADILVSYLDVFGDVTKEYYRADCRITDLSGSNPAQVLRVPYDPQGACDIYPIGE